MARITSLASSSLLSRARERTLSARAHAIPQVRVRTCSVRRRFPATLPTVDAVAAIAHDAVPGIITVKRRIWNLRHQHMSRSARHHRWLRAVAFINGQISKYTTLNNPNAVAVARECLADLMAERCLGCGKFLHVSSEKHSPTCRGSRSNRHGDTHHS